jgi:hypothetical protein
MTTTGIILIALGVAFLITALIGAALDTIRKREADSARISAEGWPGLIRAVSELLGQILKAPKWLLVFTAGLVLIGIGIWLNSGGTIK